MEVESDAPGVDAVEREDTVTDTSTDADRHDPEPRPLQPPRADVGDRGPQPAVSEVGIEVVAHVDVGVLGFHAEDEPEEAARPPPDLDREADSFRSCRAIPRRFSKTICRSWLMPVAKPASLRAR